MINGKKQKGFNIIELMVGLLVLGIFSMVALPSYVEFIEKKRLQDAMESIATDIKIAHSESITNRKTLYVTFKSGTNWCYGLDDVAGCDCDVANDCEVSGASKVVSAADYTNVSLTMSGFSTAGGLTYAEFEGLRGVLADTGNLEFAINGKSGTVNINKLGFVSYCSDDLKAYVSCP